MLWSDNFSTSSETATLSIVKRLPVLNTHRNRLLVWLCLDGKPWCVIMIDMACYLLDTTNGTYLAVVEATKAILGFEFSQLFELFESHAGRSAFPLASSCKEWWLNLRRHHS